MQPDDRDYGRNILIYWDDERADTAVADVVAQWRAACPDWSVSLQGRGSADRFLAERFGADVARLFRSCAIPAMRSDFFRVFWALSEGGLYSDLSFVPRREPLFFAEDKPLTLVRWPHGRIVNGLFFARRDSADLRRVADAILAGVALRQDNNVWSVTGPGAWIRAIGQQETDTIAIRDRQPLFRTFLKPSHYGSSTRGSDRHWSKLQERMSIFAPTQEAP